MPSIDEERLALLNKRMPPIIDPSLSKFMVAAPQTRPATAATAPAGRGSTNAPIRPVHIPPSIGISASFAPDAGDGALLSRPQPLSSPLPSQEEAALPATSSATPEPGSQQAVNQVTSEFQRVLKEIGKRPKEPDLLEKFIDGINKDGTTMTFSQFTGMIRTLMPDHLRAMASRGNTFDQLLEVKRLEAELTRAETGVRQADLARQKFEVAQGPQAAEMRKLKAVTDAVNTKTALIEAERKARLATPEMIRLKEASDLRKAQTQHEQTAFDADVNAGRTMLAGLIQEKNDILSKIRKNELQRVKNGVPVTDKEFAKVKSFLLKDLNNKDTEIKNFGTAFDFADRSREQRQRFSVKKKDRPVPIPQGRTEKEIRKKLAVGQVYKDVPLVDGSVGNGRWNGRGFEAP